MRKTYEFKNDKYDIKGYTLSDDEGKKYNSAILFGDEDDYTKWLLNINGKEIAFWNTGNNIVSDKHVIIENDDLNIITDFDYYKINLKSLKCLTHIDLSDYMMTVTCDLIKYQKGFLITCDFELIYVENEKVKWVYETDVGFEELKILKDDIIEFYVLDSYGEKMYKMHLDKDGKYIKV